MKKHEHIKAKKWRESLDLSPDQLSELTGYSPKTIYWFEQGVTPPNRNHKSGNADDRAIKPWVWQRYRMACAGVMHERKGKFDW